jgi:hypothetical protein
MVRISTYIMLLTGRQVFTLHAVPLKDPERSSNAAIQGLLQMWFAWAGAPSEMIVDAAVSKPKG